MREIDPFDAWLHALRARHANDLTFTEIRKGVSALSRIYVEERGRIGGDVFRGAGKRAAFACFYTPLHFLLVREIVRELGGKAPMRSLLDLGCGLAPAGAAWALARGGTARITGVERHAWAAREARRSLDSLGLRGRILEKRMEEVSLSERDDAVVAAYSVNELDADTRKSLLARLLRRRQGSVLIVEPIARRANRWWDEWSEAFGDAGGRADTWRFRVELPASIAELDRAAGLRHDELSGKSLFLERTS